MQNTEYCDECKRITGTDLTTGMCGGCILNTYLQTDAKKRKKQWDKEQEGRDVGFITFLIVLSLAILIGDFVLRLNY